MSRKYKFYHKGGLCFVSFATVYLVDVFVRLCTFILVESLDYYRKNKGMEIYAWCIMHSHLHLIFREKENNPGDLLRYFKTFTSKKITSLIKENPHESRREWILWLMDQKVDYIHFNPVESGFVSEPWHWKYSSAMDYSGGKGILEIDYV